MWYLQSATTLDHETVPSSQHTDTADYEDDDNKSCALGEYNDIITQIQLGGLETGKLPRNIAYMDSTCSGEGPVAHSWIRQWSPRFQKGGGRFLDQLNNRQLKIMRVVVTCGKQRVSFLSTFPFRQKAQQIRRLRYLFWNWFSICFLKVLNL